MWSSCCWSSSSPLLGSAERSTALANGCGILEQAACSSWRASSVCLTLLLPRMGLTNPWIAAEQCLTVLTSHPPLFGFSASMSLIGFAYGLWPGCLIAALASMVGSGLAFLSVRVRRPTRPNGHVRSPHLTARRPSSHRTSSCRLIGKPLNE